MTTLSRRALIGGGLALATVPFLPDVAKAADVPLRYYDTGPTIAAINAASTLTQVSAATDPFEVAAGVPILRTTAAGGLGSGFTCKPPAMTDANLKPALTTLVDAIAKYPVRSWAKLADSVAVVLTKDIVSGGVSLDYGGVTIDSSNRCYVDINSGGKPLLPLEVVVHHEMQHRTYQTAAHRTRLSALATAWGQANPPGFKWLGSAASTAPFTGDRPLGFARYYGRASFMEDIADTMGHLMSTATYGTLMGWCQTDPYLAKKVDLLIGFNQGIVPAMTRDYYAAVNLM